jgi:rubrerythrin
MKTIDVFKTINDIISLALEKEREAVQFYIKASALVANPGTKVMLKELAGEEEKHVAILVDVQSGKAIETVGANQLPPTMDLGKYLVTEPINEKSTPQDIMIIAIKREDSAIAFYSGQIPVVSGTDLQPIFEHLLAWEREHKERLEAEYDRVILKDN